MYIFDLHGLGTRHIWPSALECFNFIAQAVEENTPEIMKHDYVINGTLFNVVKAVQNSSTSFFCSARYFPRRMESREADSR